MYKHILIPTDGSQTADKAVAAGIEFAREFQARVTLFTAVPEYRIDRDTFPADEYVRRCEGRAATVFAAAAALAANAGVAFEIDFAQSDHPYRAIIEAAQRHGCDAIFMASHGRGETRAVLTHSRIPTLVYR